MGPKISMLIGLLIGYVEAFDYLNRVELGANTAAIWESKSFFKSVQSWKGKIKLNPKSFRLYSYWWHLWRIYTADVSTLDKRPTCTLKPFYWKASKNINSNKAGKPVVESNCKFFHELG